MSDLARNLSPEDRAEYDDLMHQAGYRDDGTQRPSHEIKERAHALLQEAAAAGKTWAAYVLDEDARDGHLKRFKGWDRARQVVHTRHGERLVKRSAVMSLKRRDAAGRFYYQGTFFDDMSAEDLQEVIAEAGKRVQAGRDTVATARRLLELLERTGAGTVREGLTHLGVELEEYLTGEAA